jgi:hypothetical protein
VTPYETHHSVVGHHSPNPFSGKRVALAVTKVGTKVGTNGPDTLRGTNRADNLQAMALTTHSWPWVVWTTS